MCSTKPDRDLQHNALPLVWAPRGKLALRLPRALSRAMALGPSGGCGDLYDIRDAIENLVGIAHERHLVDSFAIGDGRRALAI